MGRHARKQFDSDNFLTTEHQSIWVRWPGQVLAIVATVVLVVTGVQYAERWTSARPQSSDATVVASAPELTSADVVARHAVAAFGDSAVGTDTSVTPVQRAVGMPVDPVTGLTRDTAAGPVQIVLPGGLGPAQTTVDGHVVYPNRGAGFDFLAENTGSGTRTIARIPDPSGPRAVTTFVRTPADTVMLAHTSGYLTINRATPTADTVAVFSPAETRDATGALVPSSYVVRQLRPGLYQMTEVIDPTPETVFPVFVDPPLHVGGLTGAPLPVGFLDTLSGAVDAVGGAITTAANATVTGVQAAGTFVKNNPLESAMLVGGVALAITGVGGPAGAAAIAAATVNLSSAGLDIAAAAMPDNELLANASTIIGVVSMATPQGAAKKVVKEGLEELTEQAARNADTVIDVAQAAPTPPGKLVDEITGVTPGRADVPGAATPKAPNAPPTTGSGIPEGYVIPGGEHSWPLPPAAADRRLSTNITSRVSLSKDTKKAVRDAARYDKKTGRPFDANEVDRIIEGTPHFGHKPGFEERVINDMVREFNLSRQEKKAFVDRPEMFQLEDGPLNSSGRYERPRPAGKVYEDYKDFLRDNFETNPKLAADPTAQRRFREEIQNPTPNIRSSSERANINADMREANSARTVPRGGGQRGHSESSDPGSGTSGSQQRDDRGGNKDRTDSSNSGSKKKDDKKKSEPKKKKKKTQMQKKRRRG